jgi:hypothetical protein
MYHPENGLHLILNIANIYLPFLHQYSNEKFLGCLPVLRFIDVLDSGTL